MSDRGLTPLVGFILLVGITAVGAMSLFVVGMSLADATQSSAEQEQLDQSMAQFADTANTIASSNSDSDEFQLSGADDGSGAVISDAGHIEMWVENDTSEQTLLDSQLGAYRYQTADGYEVAYQGGGVWRTSGDGSAQVVQSPPFDYRNEDDPTLTYEFVRVLGSNSETGDVTGSLNRVNNSNVYPGPDGPNPLQNGSVHLQVESDYCEGWESFFRQRTDGAVQESCDSSVNTDVDEVRIEFSVPFHFSGPGGDATVARSIDEHKGGQRFHPDNPGNSDVRNHDSPLPDDVVESRLAQCDEGDGEALSSDIEDPGLYCADSMSGSYTFNVSDGDIEIAIDGDVNPGQIDLEGLSEENNVTIFAGGNVATHVSNSDWGEDGHAEHFRILIPSYHNFGEKGSGNMNIDTFIYAPGSDITLFSNMDFKGGMIGDFIDVQANSGGYNPDGDVTNMPLSFEQGGEPFYYLHVSETALNVQSD